MALLEQCAHFFQALATHHPLLLVLDDLQWADRGSVNLLFHLGRRLSNSRMLILGAYRPEEVHTANVVEQHPLEKVLGEFRRRFGNTWMDLSQINQEDGRNFIAAYLDTMSNRIDADFREQLFQRTLGHPLFTIELLRDMQARADLVQDVDGYWIPGPKLDWVHLPARVEAVIASRLDRLNQRERKILEVACVEGNAFTAEVAGRVVRLPPNTIFTVLDQECGNRHRLVTDLGDTQINGRSLSRYKFNHPLFNAYLINSMSSGKRRLLHGEVAKALEALYGEATDRCAVELAYHYDAAGNLEKAVPYLLAAGGQAQMSSANDEAITYFQRILNLLDDRSFTPRDKKWQLQAHQGLGVIFMNTGRITEAKMHLINAIDLGKKIKIPLDELIILYHWLGEVYIWQNRPEDRIRIGMEGLVLLGDNTISVEAALMNQAVAMVYWLTGNGDKFREYTLRTIRFIQQLPDSTELNVAYIHAAIMYMEDKDVDGSLYWIDQLEKKAIENQESRYLGEALAYRGEISFERGEFKAALDRLERAQGLFNQIGDRGQEPGGSLHLMGWIYLSLGELKNAAHLIQKNIQTARAYGVKRWIAKNTRLMGQIYLAKCDWEKAADCFQKALQLSLESNDQESILLNNYLLGRVNLTQNNPEEGLKYFERAIASADSQVMDGYLNKDPHITRKFFISPILIGLENAFEDLSSVSRNRVGKFQALCQQMQSKQSGSGERPFVQWYLQPANLFSPHKTLLVEADFCNSLDHGWIWHDPVGGCSSHFENGIVIKAANGRDMRYLNLSAPRLLRPAKGDFTIQTICQSSFLECPAIGGLLLWQDKKNYVFLEWGRHGDREISFQGCVDNRDFIIGRGQLPKDGYQHVYLQLKRSGEQVNAYCSCDGQNWYTVGHCVFPVDEPVQVGLHASGTIPREIYYGAYPDGTAILFKKFWLWGE